MWNDRLDEAQIGIVIAERNINNLRCTNNTTLTAESKELKSLLMQVKQESEKAGLKLSIQKTKIMASSPFMANRWGNSGNSDRLLFSWAPKSLQLVTAAMKLKEKLLEEKSFQGALAPWKKSSDQPREHTEKQRHYFANKVLSSQSYGFSSSHVWMWELNHKESWVPKNWCFWTVVLEKTLESPLDSKEIKPVDPKGDQSWIFIGSTDAEAETPTLWPPDGKNWLTGKDPDVGKDWRQEEKGTMEDVMAGWDHWLNGHEFE